MGKCVQIPFSDDLLAKVCEHLAEIPQQKRHCARVLLPHRRACRRLREMLVARHGTQLFPRILPLGEPDMTEFGIGGQDVSLLPQVSLMARKLIFTSLLCRAREQDHSPGTLAQDYLQAKSLGHTLDRLQEFDHDLSSLQPPECAEHAGHWARAARFLDIVQGFWPEWCKEQNCLDAIPKRNAALRGLAADLGDDPIIIAGSSGRANAVQDLMRAVLQHPEGAVFLQGTELLFPGEDLQVIAETPVHPAYTIARLWLSLGLGEEEICTNAAEEIKFYRAAFRLRGRDIATKPMPKNLHGLVFAEHQDEVTATALLVREALAKNSQAQVAVITDDENFHFALERSLSRWNIALDRAAGMALVRTAEGRLASLLLEILRDGLGVVSFFALLKHPLVLLGQERRLVWAGIVDLENRFLSEGYDEDALKKILSSLEEYPWLKPLQVLFEKQEKQNFNEFYKIIVQVFRHCVINAEHHLPLSPATQAVQDFWQDFHENIPHGALGELSSSEWASLLLEELQQRRVAIGTQAEHKALALSHMEARLMRFDRVIIPRMHHGSMPISPPASPWMARPQYRECGIPEPEELIGLAAHDFIQLCHQTEVFLLRAEKSGDQLMAASVWWDRLDAVARMHSPEGLVSNAENTRWQRRVKALYEAVDNPSHGQPRPRPPLESRPKRISVTEINTLLLNPYETYVQKVLRLRPLPLRTEDTYSLRVGKLFHQLLQEYIEQGATLPEQWFHKRAGELMEDRHFRPFEHFTLHHQVQRMAANFLRSERQLQSRGNFVECSGVWEIAGVQISGKVDRLAETDKGLELWDYKTGTIPGAKEVKKKCVWQLPLLALMCQNGAFPDVGSQKVQRVGYWRTSGSKKDSQTQIMERPPKGSESDEFETFLEDVAKRLAEVFRDYAQKDAVYTAFPDPENPPQFCNIDHCIRAEEWQEQLIVGDDDA